MFPFIYYIDCEGNLWVPCNCRCSGGNGAAAGSAALPQVRYTDSCEKREFECIRPASESEKNMLSREQAMENRLEEALEAIKRLEQLIGRQPRADAQARA